MVEQHGIRRHPTASCGASSIDRRALATLSLAFIALLLASCWPYGGLQRPTRIVDPETVGVVASVDRTGPTVLTVELGDGQHATIDEGRTTQLYGSGVGEGQLLLLGKASGRDWYISSSITETSSMPNCYYLTGTAGAFDEPDAVVFVFSKMPDVGIRIHKADGFTPPDGALSSDGRYFQGELDFARFCLNQDGRVFGRP